jgi:hypothetical protein
VKWLVVAAALCSACGRDNEQINCRDLLPASETHFSDLAAIITDENDPRSCAGCHSASTPLAYVNLGTPRAAYFTLRDRIDHIYAKVASGEMPRDGQSWDASDLRLLRSWYCRGALDD